MDREDDATSCPGLQGGPGKTQQEDWSRHRGHVIACIELDNLVSGTFARVKDVDRDRDGGGDGAGLDTECAIGKRGIAQPMAKLTIERLRMNSASFSRRKRWYDSTTGQKDLSCKETWPPFT